MTKPPQKSTPASSSNQKASRRAAQRRSRQRSRLIQVVAGLAAVVGLIVLAVFLLTNERASVPDVIEGVQTFPNLARDHTAERVAYAQTPPAGGSHNPAWQNCGVYAQPIPNENAVHSLEHGAIWITYHPDLPESEVQTLQELTRQSGFRLLSPYPDLPRPIVLSAWGYQLQLEQADDPRLTDFLQKYEQNPQGPEPGAPCTGGLGQPG